MKKHEIERFFLNGIPIRKKEFHFLGIKINFTLKKKQRITLLNYALFKLFKEGDEFIYAYKIKKRKILSKRSKSAE